MRSIRRIRIMAVMAGSSTAPPVHVTGPVATIPARAR
jgi:hypothetical protein